MFATILRRFTLAETRDGLFNVSTTKTKSPSNSNFYTKLASTNSSSSDEQDEDFANVGDDGRRASSSNSSSYQSCSCSSSDSNSEQNYDADQSGGEFGQSFDRKQKRFSVENGVGGDDYGELDRLLCLPSDDRMSPALPRTFNATTASWANYKIKVSHRSGTNRIAVRKKESFKCYCCNDVLKFQTEFYLLLLLFQVIRALFHRKRNCRRPSNCTKKTKILKLKFTVRFYRKRKFEVTMFLIVVFPNVPLYVGLPCQGEDSEF